MPQFLNSWAVPIGLVSIALPLLIHLLTRPRPRLCYLSTVRFVREVIQQRRATSRLRDWLVLLLRAAALLLFALTVARPLLDGSAGAAARRADTQTARVVILDVSQSLAATVNGIQALERARPIAASRLRYQSQTVWNLILAGAVPQPVFERPSTNYSTLLGEVARARALPQRLNLQAAIQSAGEMLAASGTGVRRELVVISDFQRANWTAADFSAVPADTVIELETVATPETPPNLAVLRAGPQHRAEAGRPCRLEVEVGNFSPTAKTVAVDVTAGETTVRVQGAVPPQGRAVLLAEMTLPRPGWSVGEARLVDVDDSLAADNIRPLVLRVHTPPQFVLLTRQSARLRPASSYFLERAILPEEAAAPDSVVRLDPSRAPPAEISAGDLLVLDHPGQLTDEQVQLLVSLLRQGRGMLYVTAEPVDASNLKRLARAAGSDLQLPVEFSPAGTARKNLFLTDVKQRQPPFTVFGDDALAILATVRMNGGLASRRVTEALLDDVLATYNDQSACLVVTGCGAGTLAILNADLGASNLPSSPAFVPLIGELTNQLLGQSRGLDAVPSGEPMAVALPSESSPVSGLIIVPPPSATRESVTLGELREESLGILWQSAVAGPPGAYQVQRSGKTVFALATAIPAEEADLTSISREILTDRLAGGRDVKFRSRPSSDTARDETWAWLALACLACVVGEMVCLRAFKS
ncbi:MAG: BatA and WFA domain-containing protein [Planctomycetes bacterium]|nr:BatA and WFA domain-containing protein [Planctomycetota bacterium]